MKRTAYILITALALPAVLCAEDTLAKNWKDTAQASYLSMNGNTDSTTLGLSNLFTWTKNRWTLSLPAGALTTRTEGVRTAEQYYAGEKVQYKLDDRNYAFERYQWDRDTFAGFAHRHDVSGGVGREWLKTPTDNLTTELGAGYINEQRLPGATPAREDFATGRAYSKYSHKLSATADFSQDAEYIHNFEENRDARFNAVSALTAALSTHLALRLSYGLKYRNLPPVGFSKTDTISAVSLVANY